MSSHAALYPAFAMALLTFCVWLRMFFSRLSQMKAGRIHPQSVAMSAQMAQRVTDSRVSDNFRNLFELPVLFYAALLVAFVTGAGDMAAVRWLAWAFVALRVLHSAIQCSYNRVMHRFYAYVLGGVCLWALWAVLFVRLLQE